MMLKSSMICRPVLDDLCRQRFNTRVIVGIGASTTLVWDRSEYLQARS